MNSGPCQGDRPPVSFTLPSATIRPGASACRGSEPPDSHRPALVPGHSHGPRVGNPGQRPLQALLDDLLECQVAGHCANDLDRAAGQLGPPTSASRLRPRPRTPAAGRSQLCCRSATSPRIVLAIPDHRLQAAHEVSRRTRISTGVPRLWNSARPAEGTVTKCSGSTGLFVYEVAQDA